MDDSLDAVRSLEIAVALAREPVTTEDRPGRLGPELSSRDGTGSARMLALLDR